MPEEPSSPQIEEESKTAKDDVKPKGSYALADMEKATFDAVSSCVPFSESKQINRGRKGYETVKM